MVRNPFQPFTRKKFRAGKIAGEVPKERVSGMPSDKNWKWNEPNFWKESICWKAPSNRAGTGRRSASWLDHDARVQQYSDNRFELCQDGDPSSTK